MDNNLICGFYGDECERLSKINFYELKFFIKKVIENGCDTFVFNLSNNFETSKIYVKRLYHDLIEPF